MAIKYVLKTPVLLGDETLAILELEEPSVGKMLQHKVDLSEAVLSTVKGMSKLLLACSVNATDAHIARMKLSDLTGAIGECTSFFGEQ